jgi:chromosome segregation ATPase
MANDLTARLQAALNQAEFLVQRCDSLEIRIAELAVAPVGQDGPGEDNGNEFSTTLNSFTTGALETLEATVLDAESPLNRVAAQIGDITDEIAEMPDRLEAAVRTKLLEAQDEYAGRAAEAIERIETAYAETEEKITEALDQTFEQFKEQVGEAHDKVGDALNKVKEAVSDAEGDVRRIVGTLARTRDTILSACRGAGVGAEAAAPAIEAGTAAFTAVS